jgi:nickel-dependent lactate racemase
MRTLKLRCGAGQTDLHVPRDAPVREYGIRDDLPAARDPAAALARALDPLRQGEFRDLARGGHVGVLLDDATRSEPHLLELSAVLDLLADVAVESATVFVCTGTHDGRMPENTELLAALNKAAATSRFPKAEVVMHDCRGPLDDVGRTSRGTRLYVNGRARTVDVFLAVSDMKNHYFAGYSNPVKGLLPGICGFETARGNHSLALDPKSTFGHHPWHPDAARRDHPLAEDMVEAAGLILAGRPAYALCLFTRGRQEILWAQSGPMSQAAGAGMTFVDRATSVTVAPARRVIVSAGGHPLDESLYAAQRALELTKNAVSPSGEVLFFAACKNGVGPPEAVRGFYDRLKGDLDAVLRSFGGEYEMYSHKTYKFACMLKQVAAIYCVTDLDDATLAAVHLKRERNPQAVVDRWLRASPAEPILVFHDAGKLAVHAARAEPSPRA